jgi:hypothetical protein
MLKQSHNMVLIYESESCSVNFSFRNILGRANKFTVSGRNIVLRSECDIQRQSLRQENRGTKDTLFHLLKYFGTVCSI